ncbi:1-acyl-sn-glycerol-3-phosphate acyltransferase [Mangrovibacillus cuniculi]|uniref:1-acyl-sn-glycerol-3-phosphate acyltransferase n=2 Tax=Mangrovibacillus cuniculi TaxID=2593652 RepID=A0A7S8CEC9_9BACI|nr:1-acyl-sn-glycerol-3-phosphate acyltransferase [Mangrovibacillus cuniculi]
MYLILSIPSLRKAQKVSLSERSTVEKDQEIHTIPKKWARSFLHTTGSSVKVINKAGLPNGPVVLVSNHEGNFDIPVLIGYVEKPFGLMSKVEVKKVPLIRDWMEVMSCLFVDRKNRRQAVAALKQGVKQLKDGHSLLVFPEGTRSLGKGIGEFKSGSVRIAKDAEVPIVPIVISGTAAIFERQKPAIKPSQVTISILPEITRDEVISLDQKELNSILHEKMKEEWERISTSGI